MQYLLLIYGQEKHWMEMDPAEQTAITREFAAFGKQFAPAIRGGNALQPTPVSKTVRVRDGKTQVTDGPFAETKEQLAGYYLIEAADAEEAAAIAANIPIARFGSVEVRPIRIIS